MREIEEQTISNAEKMVATLQRINKSLEVLAEKLKESQPKAPGAITLHLYPCGRDCLGCNHRVWLQWYERKASVKGDKSKFLSKKIDNPLKRIRRKGKFEESYPLTKALIMKTEELLERKSEIVKRLSAMNKMAGNL